MQSTVVAPDASPFQNLHEKEQKQRAADWSNWVCLRCLNFSCVSFRLSMFANCQVLDEFHSCFQRKSGEMCSARAEKPVVLPPCRSAPSRRRDRTRSAPGTSSHPETHNLHWKMSRFFLENPIRSKFYFFFLKNHSMPKSLTKSG